MLTRTGACIHCGKCCLPPITIENSNIVRGQDRCLFYTDTENTDLYGHCLIYGRSRGPVKNVRDRFGVKITTAQIAWWEANCGAYPRAIDAEIGVYPPPECGFSFEVSDG